MIAFALVKPGPHLSASAPFDWHYATRALRYRPTRLANFGYLGHMWETLRDVDLGCPLFILASFDEAGWSSQYARLAGFGVVGIGAAGCVLAGALADRMGRTSVTSMSMIISGGCALVAGLAYDHPALLTVICLIWGLAVVADSAQFSAAVSELSDPRYVGTALTVQTCLGFLLTPDHDSNDSRRWPRFVGWRWVFAVLALGPAFGTMSMLRLRRLPEAKKMASGNR